MADQLREPGALRIAVLTSSAVDVTWVSASLDQASNGEYSVRWFHGRDDAIAALQGPFDIALMEAELAAAGDWSLLKARGALAPMPIVILADREDPAVERAALAAGAADVVGQDSVNPPLLARAIRHAVFRHATASGAGDRKQYLRGVVENSFEGVLLLDRSGVIVHVSDMVERLTGYPADRLIGSSAFSLVHPDDVRPLKRVFDRSVAAPGRRERVEYRVYAQDGSWRHHEAVAISRLDHPAVGAIVVNYHDVTVRKHAQNALIESERAYRDTFDNAPLGVAHIGLDGRWVLVNSRFCELLGCPAEELVSKDVTAIVFEDDAAADAEARTRLLTGAADRHARRRRYRRKDGGTLWVDETVSLLRNAAGAPRRFLVMVLDLSERLRLEEQFRQAQKVEAIGQLAGGIAHDFNNLLTAIGGFSDLALEQLEPTHRARADLQNVIESARSAAAVTQQLLAFSRRQILQPQILDLNVVVRRLDVLLRRVIGEHIELVSKLAPSVERVSADPGQIEQVIVNLAVNSRDAMAGGGRLTIETANVELDEDYTRRHPGSRPGRHVMLAVSDTGSAWTRPRWCICSSRSSRPRSAARAPGSVWRRFTVS